MRNLFSAHLFRLVRARIFYFGMAALFVMELYLLYSNHGDIVSGTASVDNTFFFFTMMGVIAVSAFCGLFVGAEYSSGSLRNKLITGHTKTAVYLSCLLVSGLAAVAFFLCAVAGGLICCLAWQTWFVMDAGRLAGYLAASLGVAIAMASLCTLLSLSISSRSTGVVAALLIVMALLFFGNSISTTLDQPEQIPQITTIFDEESGQYSYVYPDENTPMVDNPSYPRGTTRAVYQVLYDFLPTSQTFQLSRAETETPWLLALWSLLFTVFITAAGLCLFQRKDIK